MHWLKALWIVPLLFTCVAQAHAYTEPNDLGGDGGCAYCHPHAIYPDMPCDDCHGDSDVNGLPGYEEATADLFVVVQAELVDPRW